MKIFLTWASCLAVLICYSSASSQVQQSVKSSVAVIDINFIFKNHVLFKGKMDDMQEEVKGFESYLQQQQTEITQQTEHLKSLNPGSPEYQQLEETIAAKHTQLRIEAGRKRKDILDREARVYYHAYKDIEQQVQQFAYANGIDLVLRFSGDEMDITKRESVLQGVNRAVVFHHQRDITTAVLDALNRRAAPGVSQQPQVPGRTPARR